MNEMKWIEVNRGKMSDLMDLMRSTLWKSPYGQLRVSLSKWLDVSENQCPYQNDQNRWEMNELKWIEVNRGKMSEWMDLMRSTLWKSPYGR